MKIKNFFSKTATSIVFILVFAICASQADAELKINSVYPTMGIKGQDLPVTITGSGFDANTRVVMSLDVENRKNLIGSVVIGEDVSDIKIVGSLAYVLSLHAFKIIDIEIPSRPVIIGSLDIAWRGQSLIITENIAYIASSDRLSIIDITDPSNPFIISYSDTDRDAKFVIINGDYVYMADGSSLKVIDVSCQSNPVIIRSLDMYDYIYNIAISGNYVYVIAGGSLRIIDVKNPSNPFIVSVMNYSNVESISYIKILNNYVYVITMNNLHVIDISNPLSPTMINTMSMSIHTRTDFVTISGNIMYISTSIAPDDSGLRGGILMVDISIPSKPVIMGYINMPSAVILASAIKEDKAYIATDGEIFVIPIPLEIKPVTLQSSSEIRVTLPKPILSGCYTIHVFNDSVFQELKGSVNFSEIIGNFINPKIGVKGRDLSITLVGDGFNADSRVAMFLDVATQGAFLGDSAYSDGTVEDIAVNGNFAYIANTWWGLQILDISNPSHPFMKDYIKNELIGITLSGNKAYFLERENMGHNIVIFDITDPSSPSYISRIVLDITSDIKYYADFIEIYDNIAYIIDGSSLMLININNILEPFLIGKLETEHFYKYLNISNNRAYIGYDNGLIIADITDSSNPITIIDINMSNYGTAFTNYGNLAYVVNGVKFHVIDISNPLIPIIIGTEDIERPSDGTVKYMTVSKDKVYIADCKDKLQIIDVGNPSKPTLMQSIYLPLSSIQFMKISDNNIYYVANSRFQIADISKPSVSSIIGAADTPNNAKHFTISGNLAYVADYESGLQIIDISNISKPFILGNLDTPSYASKVKISGNLAYVADGNSGLQIIDITIPSNPVSIGSVDTYWASDVIILNNYAYLADGSYGLKIIDISNPSEPTIIGHVDTECANSVEISGDIAYVVNSRNSFPSGSLDIIDISNPNNPIIIETVYIPGDPKSIVVSDNIAYIAAGEGGLQVLDISDPTNPIIISDVYAGNAESITINGNTAYVAGNNLQIIDITTPTTPIVISTIDTPSKEAYFADVISDKAYIAAGSAGLVILPLPIEIDSVNIKSPNQITLTLPSPQIPGNYTIRVFNNTGEASELPGAVTFVPPEDSYLLDTKAIIIAGDKSGNNIRTETQTSADFAYQTLLFQGYTAESVNYLSFDTSQPGVDAKASLAAVSDAVNNWSIKDPKATELLIYLVGHGEDGYFVINDNEHLSVEQLDQWLDNLQNAYDIPVTVIYDACYSGSFLPKLTPPVGKKRVVISSASAAEKAYFPVSAVSFSYQFWNAVYQGNEIGKAFRAAANQMKTYQTAMMDADGDGIGTEAEIALAENMKIRRNYKPLTDVPYIYRVSDPQVLHDQTSAKITAGVSYIQDGTKVQRVWATIVPPDFRPDGPVANLPEIELTDPDGDGIYENTYTQFVQNGTYKINVCAMNQKGMFALFRDTTVVRETGYIAAVSQDQVISQNSAKIWAALKPDIPVTRVWARIIPPISNGTPVETELSDPEHDGIYETVFSGFTADGTYIAELHATDAQGYTSPAVLSKITYGSGAGQDDYEQDSTPELAGIPDFNTVQHHNFHTSEDTDWIKGFLSKDISYSIRIPNRTLCLPAIDLLKQAVPGDVNSDKKTDLKDVIAVLRIAAGLKTSANIFSDVNRDGKIGIEEALYGLQTAAGLIAESGSRLMTVKSSDASFDWTPPETGVYYFKISNTVPGVFGQNVTYDFGIYKATAGIGGTIRGTVKSPSGEPVSEAMIFTDDGGTDLSRDNGAFSITDSVGKRIITVQADGYEEYRTAVTVTETTEQFLNIVLSPSH